MGKVVKYCSTCEESFAEKFGFCPTCGATLQPFEMNPVVAEPVFVAEPIADRVNAPIVAAPAEITPVEEIVKEANVVIPEEAFVATTPPAPVFIQTQAKNADVISPNRFTLPKDMSDGGFHVTVIEEKNVGQRNSLLLGTLGVMLVMLMSGVVYSLFSKDLGVGSIDDEMFNAVLLDDQDLTIEEKQIQKEDKKNGGGGGGGGKEEPEPPSQGERPPMLKDPQFNASARSVRLTDPDIAIQQAIKGPINETTKDPNKTLGVNAGQYNTVSDGSGLGGGIGTGRGTGVGGGNGTGAGNGNGSGLGNGNGNGIGDDNGNGGNLTKTTPPTAKVGVTQGLKIISKPKATYTDAARQNQVQGSVTLRITFLANGSIGSITPVSGLGYGLTEQAIAAARRIQFEPAKSNGQAQTVTKTFQYGFTIY